MKEVINDFPIIRNSNVVYLDNAATSQKPDYVIDSVKNYYETINANPHRGTYNLSVLATMEYQNARESVRKLINAKNIDEIIFTKNATESLNLIAYSYALDNINSGDEIILSIMEHHSNLVPWQMVCKTKGATLKYMYIDDNYEIKESEYEKITDKTALVAITHISNVTGTVNDIEKICKIAHSHNAKVIIDASQSIAHKKIDVQKLDCDFLVFSGHKMYAPMGIGVLYAKKEILEKMRPFLMGGDMIEYVYEDHTTYAPLPERFEAGTQNVSSAVGINYAIKYIEKIGYDKIQKYEEELLNYAKEQLEKLDFLELYYTKNSANHSNVISFNIKGVHPHDVATILDNLNIAIRSGNHCAQPLLRYLKLDSTCRASICIYNTKNDIDLLVDGLIKVNNMFKKFKRD